MAGVVELRVRAHPAGRADARCSTATAHRRGSPRSRSSRSCSSCSRLPVAILSAPSTSSTATSATSSRHVLRLWFYLSPGLYGDRATSTESPTTSRILVRPIMLLNPFAVLFTAYRDVIYDETPARLDGASSSWSARRSSSSRSRRCCSSGSSRRSRRSCDGDRRREPPGERDARPSRSRSTSWASSYSLRFTKKTTLRQSFSRACSARERAGDFWALRDVSFQLVHGESLARHRPERRRQEHAPPGAGRDHHAVGGRGRRATATCRAC